MFAGMVSKSCVLFKRNRVAGGTLEMVCWRLLVLVEGGAIFREIMAKR